MAKMRPYRRRLTSPDKSAFERLREVDNLASWSHDFMMWLEAFQGKRLCHRVKEGTFNGYEPYRYSPNDWYALVREYEKIDLEKAERQRKKKLLEAGKLLSGS
jgi:hypothetical protein